MNIKELFTEDRGVSPVIGVILMVAITVILAAVIGAFVIGLGDSAQQTAPQASIDFDFQGNDNVTLVHGGGDRLDPDEISVTIDGFDQNDDINVSAWGNGDITAGDSLDVVDDSEDIDNLDDVDEGDTIRVVWEGGDSSNTLAERDFP